MSMESAASAVATPVSAPAAPTSSGPEIQSPSLPSSNNSSKAARQSSLDLLKGEFKRAQEARNKQTPEAPAPKSEPVAQQTQEPSVEAKAPISGDKFEIEVGGRKVEFDFNDRDKLKSELKARYDYERGMRKMQVERDKLQANLKPMQEKLQKLETNWAAMDKAFQEGGEEGLIDLLRGKSGAYKDYIKQQIDRHEFLKTASADEKAALESREREDRYRRDLEKEREANTKFREEMKAREEATELKSLQGVFDSAADKFGFQGKLGNAEDENFLDDMMFNQVKQNLASQEEVTPELIRKEFNKVATRLRSRIGMQAEKQASKSIEAKKQTALESVQTAVRNDSVNVGKDRDEAMNLVKQGKVGALLKNWGKYSQYLK